MITLCKDLKKHAKEFRNYLATGAFERTDSGIYFPRASVTAHGAYVHNINGMDERTDSNMIPDEGMHYMLDVSINNGTKIAAWYLGLYSTNYTVTSALTGTNWNSSVTEITAYDEAARPAFTPASFGSTDTAISNVSSKAVFTMSGTETIYGCVLVQTAAKSTYTAKLLSASTFSAGRAVVDNDVFNLGYTVDLA